MPTYIEDKWYRKLLDMNCNQPPNHFDMVYQYYKLSYLKFCIVQGAPRSVVNRTILIQGVVFQHKFLFQIYQYAQFLARLQQEKLQWYIHAL